MSTTDELNKLAEAQTTAAEPAPKPAALPQQAVDLKAVVVGMITGLEKQIEDNKIITAKLTERTKEFDAFAHRAANFFNEVKAAMSTSMDCNFKQLAVDVNAGMEKPITHVLTTAIKTLKEETEATNNKLIDHALKQKKWSAVTGNLAHFTSGACGGFAAFAIVTGHLKYLYVIPVILIVATFISQKFSR